MQPPAHVNYRIATLSNTNDHSDLPSGTEDYSLDFAECWDESETRDEGESELVDDTDAKGEAGKSSNDESTPAEVSLSDKEWLSVERSLSENECLSDEQCNEDKLPSIVKKAPRRSLLDTVIQSLASEKCRQSLSMLMIVTFMCVALNFSLIGTSEDAKPDQQIIYDRQMSPYYPMGSAAWQQQQQFYQPLAMKSRMNMNYYQQQFMPASSNFAHGQYSGVATNAEEITLAQSQSDQRGESWDWVERDVPVRESMAETAKAKNIVNPMKEAAGQSDADGTSKVSELFGYKDVWEPHEYGDQPVFWHIAKAGGSTVKNVMGTCHRFTLATESGVRKGHHLDTVIAVVRPNKVAGQDSTPFVNVDPTTIPGLERAARMGLAESNLADCIVTPFFHHAEILFQGQNRGRLFAIFRNPIERAVSMFYYLQIAEWEETYNPELKKMSLAEFAKSDLVEDNWMVRRLSNTIRGKLNEEHLKIATDIIRRKFLVGLLSRREESLERFEKFFGWKFRVNPPNQEKCREKLLQNGANKNTKQKERESIEPGTEAHSLLARRNEFDMRLYAYIENLFDEQEQFVARVGNNFRNIDATCSKCVPPTFPQLDFDEF